MERKNEAQKAKKKSKDDSRRREGKEGKGVGGRGPVTSHDMWRGLHHSEEYVCLSCVENGEEDADALWLLASY